MIYYLKYHSSTQDVHEGQTGVIYLLLSQPHSKRVRLKFFRVRVSIIATILGVCHMKKITVLAPRSEFSSEAVKLELAGDITFLPSEAKTLKDYIKVSKQAEILAYDPSRVGKDRAIWLHEIIKASPNIKALALNTTTYEYVDSVQVAERGIRVITVPETSTESVAEHTLMLLLACSKRLLINETRTFKRRYVPELGVELKDKVLGIIGMGKVGERLAELVQPLHMKILSWDQKPIRTEGVERQGLNMILGNADFLAILLPETEEYHNLLSKEKISWLNEGVSIVNMAGPKVINEKGLVEGLKTGLIGQYVEEKESLVKSPLASIETAHLLKPYSCLTKQVRRLNRQSWVRAIANLAGYSTS